MRCCVVKRTPVRVRLSPFPDVRTLFLLSVFLLQSSEQRIIQASFQVCHTSLLTLQSRRNKIAVKTDILQRSERVKGKVRRLLGTKKKTSLRPDIIAFIAIVIVVIIIIKLFHAWPRPPKNRYLLKVCFFSLKKYKNVSKK